MNLNEIKTLNKIISYMDLKNILGKLISLHILKSVQVPKEAIDPRPDFINGYARKALAQVIRIVAVSGEL